FKFKKQDGNNWDLRIVLRTADIDNVSSISFSDDGKLSDPQSITIGPITFKNGAAEIQKLELRFDKENTTQQARETSIKAVDTDGYGPGTLDSINIDSSGRVIGLYTNGRMQVEAIIAIASFNNPAGLAKMGNNLFYNTPNSGEVQLGMAGTSGLGSI